MTPTDFTPIFCAFYTRGTLYEAEAARLRASLDALGLPHNIEAIESLGEWAANASQTAAFCVRMIEKHNLRPVVYLDADAVVHRFPDKFYRMDGIDIAAHWVNGTIFANGTVYFGKTMIAADIARRYAALVVEHGGKHPNEQRLLEQSINEHQPGVKLERLPASYCMIEDHNGREADEVVIQHLQASRENARGSDAHQRRQKWIADLAAP